MFIFTKKQPQNPGRAKQESSTLKQKEEETALCQKPGLTQVWGVLFLDHVKRYSSALPNCLFSV